MKNLINKEIQLSKKVKSSKFLKSCFVGCLATCLTLTGVFAFAPLGASAHASSNNSNSSLNNNLNNSTTSTTESAGLITPHADDPVIFTTESGLEIKFGSSSMGYLSSGNLSNFLYFTTIKNALTYTWVIIGISESLLAVDNIWYPLWIKSNDSSHISQYFRNNSYESLSPAGIAINIDLQIFDVVIDSLFSGSSFNITASSELTDGCVLVVSNDCVATGQYHKESVSGAKYHTSVIKNYFDEFFTTDTFGLGSIRSNIVESNLTTYYKSTAVSHNEKIFPLAGAVSSSTFKYSTYLSGSQFKTTSNFWLRDIQNDGLFGGSDYQYCGWFFTINGSIDYRNLTKVYGYRPAFQLLVI